MKIACICPTYKRPQLLANSIACFEAQQYPKYQCKLFILDDAQQYNACAGTNWSLLSSTPRFRSLPEKYNALLALASKWSPDVFVVWEDDDVYLSWHLWQVQQTVELGAQFIRWPKVWSNYQQPIGSVVSEDARGRFHGSWAFTAEMLRKVGGYPSTEMQDFDQQFGAMMNAYDPQLRVHDKFVPSYVYRWRPTTYHHFSQCSANRMAEWWTILGNISAPFVPELIPKMDAETKSLYASISAP